MAQAQEEAQRTLQLAREKSDGLVERDAVVTAAESRADQIIQQANLDAEATRQEADDYVIETLTSLEMELERVLNQVRNGIRTVMQQQEEKRTEMQARQDQNQRQ